MVPRRLKQGMGICCPGISPFLMLTHAGLVAFPSYKESLPETSKAEEGRGEGMFIPAFPRRSFLPSLAGHSCLPLQAIPVFPCRPFLSSLAGRSCLPLQVIPAFPCRSFPPSPAGRSRLPPQVIPLPSLQVIPRWEPGHPACRQWVVASCFGMYGQNGLSPPR